MNWNIRFGVLACAFVLGSVSTGQEGPPELFIDAPETEEIAPPAGLDDDSSAGDGLADSSEHSEHAEDTEDIDPGIAQDADSPPDTLDITIDERAESIDAHGMGQVEILPHDDANADTDAPSSVQVEVIRERYPNANIKVEREVTQDENENYINHGQWKMWDPNGNVMVEGRYVMNKRDGLWIRYYRAQEVKLLTTLPYNQFQAPYTSQATFEMDQMQGDWVILDAKKQKISQWGFLDGRRHGTSTWWYANGRKMRELTYRFGEMNGELLEWGPDGKLVTRDRYMEGRRLTKRTDRYDDRQKKSEGMFLEAKLIVKTPDNWWEASLAQYTREGQDERHGTWTAWYSNGQKKIEGEYQYDRPEGTFAWWHPNGQKALEASYEAGKKTGTWTWWHANGQKSIKGRYTAGTATHKWIWWQENGHVAQRADFADGNGQVVAASPEDPDQGTTIPDQPRAMAPNPDAIRK